MYGTPAHDVWRAAVLEQCELALETIDLDLDREEKQCASPGWQTYSAPQA